MKKSHKPNILLLMADQMTPFALPCYGHPLVKADNITKLAVEGALFSAAYANNPLCAPSRFSMLSGRHSSAIGAYDNAAEFPSKYPTIAHSLRLQGYATHLIGKMHFVGADQLHGFEHRHTTDIYPADFGWTPNWNKPEERIDWWFHNMSSVIDAGVTHTSNQLDYDDEVAFHAQRVIRDLGRSADDQPFFLCVSFIHPHDPYLARQEYWNLYADEDIDLPRVRVRPTDLDPHSQRLYQACGIDQVDLQPAQIRNARHAYYANVSYIDHQVGRIIEELHRMQLADDTLIVFVSDHGDMLGERGLWYKMSFFEWSSRVPMIFHWPSVIPAAQHRQPVSLLDLFPTLIQMTDSAIADDLRLDGNNLLPILQGNTTLETRVYGEYLAEGALAPILMLRDGAYKYIYSETDPVQLYNLDDDADELNNLALHPDHRARCEAFYNEMNSTWNLTELATQVRIDQQQRRLVNAALRAGKASAWDYKPPDNSEHRFMRNQIDLTSIDNHARFPRHDEK